MSAAGMGRLRLAGIALVGCLALGSGAPAASAETCKTGTATFESTSTQQCYEVPAGVTKLSVMAVGGKGGEGFVRGTGGFGAVVSAQLSVAPGHRLYVEVGSNGCLVKPGCEGPVFGGGGTPRTGVKGASGGGASDVRERPLAEGEPSLLSRLLVASGGGGGGGAGAEPSSGQPPGGSGGNAGFEASGDGEHGGSGESPSSEAIGGEGGKGGTSSAGGKGGEGGSGEQHGLKGEDGAFATGGSGAAVNSGGPGVGGNGGGGWYGGGGGGTGGEDVLGEIGGGGGGGAGSSFVASSGTGATFATDTSGTPHVTICTSLQVQTSSLPQATRGMPYKAQLAACDGRRPYKWKKVGKLPKGLKLTSTGTIEGTPSTKLAPGSYPVGVKVTDSEKPKQSATATLTLKVN